MYSESYIVKSINCAFLERENKKRETAKAKTMTKEVRKIHEIGRFSYMDVSRIVQNGRKMDNRTQSTEVCLRQKTFRGQRKKFKFS